MAVQVIGKAESVLREVTCKHCTSILKYAPVDVKSFISTDYTGGRDRVSYIVCPSCAEKVYVR